MREISWSAAWFVLLVLLPPSAGAQETPTPLEYQKIVSVEGVGADDLYSRAREWFVESFADSESVLEIEDSDSHVLMGKGMFNYRSCIFSGTVKGGYAGRIRFTIRVETKDGRARLTLSQFTHETPLSPLNGYGLVTTAPSPGECVPSCDWDKFRQTCWDELKAAIPPKAGEIMAAFGARITQPESDDW